MQKIIYTNEVDKYISKINPEFINYYKEEQPEIVELFEGFCVIAFELYDINNIFKSPSKIIIYLDKEDLIYMCNSEEDKNIVNKYIVESDTNEHALYLFFDNLLKGNISHLAAIEDRISGVDASIIKEISKKTRDKIMGLRYEILRLKKFYEQFDFIFSELCLNDNELLNKDSLKYFRILKNRYNRLLTKTMNLKEYLMQIREAYQAEVDIEQNRLMKFFTTITSIFSPLTLLVGWYGMNLKMPEFTWKYGYLFVFIITVVICVSWFVIFKKKKWF